ncbi:alpha/beta hydrolase [Prochlorothrix hollandica]|uniref:alpha/beta hydrolase n=1 Tax=Prochlorothrix hollandica TaxID=1223 RepID=UPI0009D96926|nr:alpha/beta hydrolase [Prochlorothrix hollandica]
MGNATMQELDSTVVGQREDLRTEGLQQPNGGGTGATPVCDPGWVDPVQPTGNALARRSRSWGLALALALVTLGGGPLPQVWGADRLTAILGPLHLSLNVADLEHYAATGEITPELNSYARIATPAQLVALRDILRRPVDLSPTVVSYLAYSPTGEVILERVGQVLKTGSGQNGAIALRAAVVNGALSPDGLTLVSVLRQFPTPELRMDLRAAVAMVQEAIHLFFQEREALVQVVATTAQEEALGNTTAFGTLPDLRQGGVFTWDRYTFEWRDDRRQRDIPTDLYVPQRSQPAPIVIISHGVGNNRTSFQYLAEHLVSHGFTVVVPEHVGSNEALVRNIFQGLAQAEPREALDRLEDVHVVLDRLGTMDRFDRRWRGRFDLDQVGVIGQSFGGYTALALGGAAISFPALGNYCQDPSRLSRSLNLSLLLQCRLLELLPGIQLPSQQIRNPNPDSTLPQPPLIYGNPKEPQQWSLDFRDDRIKAIIAINPFSSLIFGQEGMARLKIPTMIMASGRDVVVPPGPEQLYPFTALTQDDRYLVLLEQGTHFSTMEEPPPNQAVFALPPNLLGPDPTIAQTYTKALGLAFMTTYLTESTAQQPYLNAAYGQYLSQTAMPLRLVQRLDRQRLDQALLAAEAEANTPPAKADRPRPRRKWPIDRD